MSIGLARPVARLSWWRAAAVWTVVALLFAANSSASRVLAGRPAPFAALLAFSWLSWIFFALITPPTAWLVRRFPLDRTGWRRGIAVAAAAGLAVLPAMALWDTLVARALGRVVDLAQVLGALAGMRFADLFEQLLLRNSAVTLTAFAALVAALHVAALRGRLRERGLEQARLETQLAESRLAALKAQLQPHFLFNTLNAIAALVHTRPDSAERMIVLLSDLLRASLSSGADHEVPLRDELGLLERYLEIELMRFPDRLRVAAEIDPETLSAAVPPLILQPLVENAIRHGISRRAACGTVTVRTRREAGTLVVEVADDGVGVGGDGTPAPGRGLGLANTRARLHELYGDGAGMSLQANDGGGALVRLTLPWRPGAAVSAAPARDRAVPQESGR